MRTNKFDYEVIKASAKKAKRKVADFLALSPGNDPFYCGSPGQMEKARWFSEIYDKMGRPTEVHIRRVHYWLVSQSPKYITPDGNEYLNNDKCWSLISIASKYARYAGFIPMENIVDRRNPAPVVNATSWADTLPSDQKDETDSEQIIDLIAQEFLCYNASNTQPYMMEIWCEKSTMNDILEPVCRNYGMNLVTGLGELSITACHLLVKRARRLDKPTRIFYISDFDPAGEGMPISVSRKIEYLAQRYDLDIKLIPLMLTADQCVEYDLPRTPIKASNTRKDDFEQRHGAGATELDALEALHPGEMKRIIGEEVERYFDIEKWNKAVETNKQLQETVRNYLEPIVENLLEHLDLSEFDEIEIGKGDLIDDSDKEWLFDSRLDYVDQLIKYKSYKN